MNPRLKRPLGITLLALLFVSTGCIGVVALPITLFSGGLHLVGDSFLSNHIRSHGLRIACESLLSFIWFAGYVLYACIGFGLRKLRRWAWRAAVIVSIICVPIEVIQATALVNELKSPLLLAILLSLGLITPIAAILWYLYRPDVREAFVRTPPIEPNSTGVPPPPIPLRQMPRWKSVLIAISAFAIFSGALMLALEIWFRASTPYAMAMKAAQESPCVIDSLGTPVQANYFMSGDLSLSGSDGSANFGIPVRGPKGTGRLFLLAKKSAGSWEITSLILKRGSEKVQLAPASESPTCHWPDTQQLHRQQPARHHQVDPLVTLSAILASRRMSSEFSRLSCLLDLLARAQFAIQTYAKQLTTL